MSGRIAENRRLPPDQLPVIERELEIAVRTERDEACSPLPAQVERFIEGNVLEVARGQDGAQREVVTIIQARRQNLAAGRHRTASILMRKNGNGERGKQSD